MLGVRSKRWQRRGGSARRRLLRRLPPRGPICALGRRKRRRTIYLSKRRNLGGSCRNRCDRGRGRLARDTPEGISARCSWVNPNSVAQFGCRRGGCVVFAPSPLGGRPTIDETETGEDDATVAEFPPRDDVAG